MGVEPKIGVVLPPKSSHLFIGFGTMIYKPSIWGVSFIFGGPPISSPNEGGLEYTCFF